MRRLFALLLALFISLPLPAATLNAQTGDSDAAPKTAPEQIIVQVNESVLGSKPSGQSDEGQVKNVLSKSAKLKRAKKVTGRTERPGKAAPAPRLYSLEIESGQSVSQALQALRADKNVISAQYNYIYEPDRVPNDPIYPQQWAHPAVNAPAAWDITTGQGSVVAIIGTGVQYSHPDLAANMWANVQEIPGNGIDDDGNGYIDDTRGWNFEFANNDPSDRETHETSVAGVIAAVSDNGLGVAGACWNCKVMPLRVSYLSTEVADAIYYAVNNGAKVINMSFGSYDIYKYGADTIVETAVNAAVGQGIMVVATAGNDSTSNMRFPGALENVVGVASTESTGGRAGFSNWGDWVDMAAPGANIYSTVPNGYAYVSGTSFSAPYVAATAAMLFEQNPALTVAEARRILEYSVDKLATDKFIGSGELNFGRVATAVRPTNFAVIKRPWQDYLLPGTGTNDIWGTALGDSYTVEYQVEGTSSWTNIGTGTETINGVLAGLDMATLPPNTAFLSLRLTTAQGTATDSYVVQVGAAGGYLTGWPKQLMSAAAYAAPKVADVDKNGTLELVQGNSSGYVYLLNSNGTPVFGWPKPVGAAYILGAPAVGDIDGDGINEVVAAAYGSVSGGGRVGVWHQNGTAVAGWPKATVPVRGSVTLVNLDADPALEIMVTGGGQVLAWNGDGTPVPGWPITLPEANINTSLAVGDLEGDGTIEIVAASYSNYYVLRTDGSIVRSWAKPSPYSADPVLADLDLDGDLELLATTYGALYVYNYDGSVKWGKLTSGTFASNDTAIAANVTGDAKPEIVLVNTLSLSASRVYVFDGNGTVVPGWPRDVVGTTRGEATVGDLDGDGTAEIVVGTEAGRVYAWNNQGVLVPGFPKGTGSAVGNSVTIADLNLDGKTDIIAGTGDGKVFAWDLQTAYVTNPAYWQQARYNLVNTARLQTPPPPPDAIAPTVSITSPANGTVVQGAVTLAANAADNKAVTKVEFYADGALVGTDTTAPYSLVWDTSAVSIGSHSVTVKAYDAAGNVGTSTAVSVTVKDTIAPTVTITSPLDGALVSRNANITIAALASDNIGLTKVEFYVNNTLKCTDTTAAYTCAWAVPKQAGVDYTIMAKAYDAAGNTKTFSAGVTSR